MSQSVCQSTNIGITRWICFLRTSLDLLLDPQSPLDMVGAPPSGHLSLPSLASGSTSEEGTPHKTLLEYPCSVFGKQREFLV